MASRFESSDSHPHQLLQPLRVPSLKDGIYQTAKELIDDLPEWTLVSEDEEQGLLRCERAARFMTGKSEIVVKVEGPEGVPSTTVTLCSETNGGMRSPDKANVQEFMKLFLRRVV